jgi:hypothetical protein
LSSRQFHFPPADGVVLPELAGCRQTTGFVRGCEGFYCLENGTPAEVCEERGSEIRSDKKDGSKCQTVRIQTTARFETCVCQKDDAFCKGHHSEAFDQDAQAGSEDQEEVIRSAPTTDPQAIFISLRDFLCIT